MHAEIITREVQSKRSITSFVIICPQIGCHPNSFTPRRARKAAAARRGATGLGLYLGVA